MTTKMENQIDSLLEYKRDRDKIELLELNIKSATHALRTCTDKEDKKDLLNDIYNSRIEITDIKSRKEEREIAKNLGLEYHDTEYEKELEEDPKERIMPKFVFSIM